MFCPRFLEIVRRLFRLRFCVIPLLAQRVSLCAQHRKLRGENRNAGFAFEERFVLRAAATAEDDSLNRNEFAGEGGGGKVRRSFFEAHRLIEIFEDRDIAQQLTDERLKWFRRFDLIHRPGERAFRQ